MPIIPHVGIVFPFLGFLSLECYHFNFLMSLNKMLTFPSLSNLFSSILNDIAIAICFFIWFIVIILLFTVCYIAVCYLPFVTVDVCLSHAQSCVGGVCLPLCSQAAGNSPCVEGIIWLTCGTCDSGWKCMAGACYLSCSVSSDCATNQVCTSVTTASRIMAGNYKLMFHNV